MGSATAYGHICCPQLSVDRVDCFSGVAYDYETRIRGCGRRRRNCIDLRVRSAISRGSR